MQGITQQFLNIHSNLMYVYISQFDNPINASLGLWEEARVPMLTQKKKKIS